MSVLRTVTIFFLRAAAAERHSARRGAAARRGNTLAAARGSERADRRQRQPTVTLDSHDARRDPPHGEQL